MKLTIIILKELQYLSVCCLCLLAAIYGGAIVAAFFYSIFNNYK